MDSKPVKKPPATPMQDNLLDDGVVETRKFVVLLWLICRFYGLVPLNLTMRRHKGQVVWVAKYSTFWEVYGYIVFSITASITIFRSVFIIRSVPPGVKLNAIMMVFLIIVFLMLLSSVVGVLRAGEHARIVVLTRKCIDKAELVIAWSKKNKSKDMKFKSLTLFFLTLWSSTLIGGVIYNYIYDVGGRLSLFNGYFYWVHALPFAMVLNFANSVYSLQGILSHINEILIQIKKDVITKSNTTEGCEVLRAKLLSVIEARCLVGKAGFLLSRDQGCSILAVIICIVGRSVVFSYNIIYELGSNGNVVSLYFHLSMCIYELFKLSSIIESVYWISKISDESKCYFSEILTTIRDVNLRGEVKYCYRQMEEQPLEFSAMDVWKVDRSLCTTVFGIILSLMIVAVQYAS